jgi:hypothetical protein
MLQPGPDNITISVTYAGTTQAPGEALTGIEFLFIYNYRKQTWIDLLLVVILYLWRNLINELQKRTSGGKTMACRCNEISGCERDISLLTGEISRKLNNVQTKNENATNLPQQI